jgi:hypothetical protein
MLQRAVILLLFQAKPARLHQRLLRRRTLLRR